MAVRPTVALLVASLLAIVRGQSSNVVQCVDSYQWVTEPFPTPQGGPALIHLFQSITQGLTPCLVAAYLESACGTRA